VVPGEATLARYGATPRMVTWPRWCG